MAKVKFGISDPFIEINPEIANVELSILNDAFDIVKNGNYTTEDIEKLKRQLQLLQQKLIALQADADMNPDKLGVRDELEQVSDMLDYLKSLNFS